MNDCFELEGLSPSVTHNGFAILWRKPRPKTELRHYQILLNGERGAICTCTDYTFKDLQPGKEYSVQVQAITKNGEQLCSGSLTLTTKTAPVRLSVEDFGAIGDGKTLNTDAIQKAIDACEPGGMITVPAGVFVTGSLYLKSDMTLNLEDGSLLQGSADIGNYPIMRYRFEGLETDCYASLINTKETQGRHRNIAITGKGQIDANGAALRQAELEENRGRPGRAICLRNTDAVYLEGITVKQSPAWCVHLIYCNDTVVNGVTIRTKCDENGRRYEGIANGDGLDPDSCKNVYIFGCTIASQDDCIAIKSGKDAPGRAVGISTERVRVSNCRFLSGFGVVIGSEMSGDVRDVLVEDCIYENAYSVASIKAPRGRGGVVEDVVYRDIEFKNMSTEHCDCEWFRGALYIDMYYSHISFDLTDYKPFDETTPVFRNIHFENITADTVAGNAIYFAGLPESPLTGITLENVWVKGLYGMKLYNVAQLRQNGVNVVQYKQNGV